MKNLISPHNFVVQIFIRYPASYTASSTLSSPPTAFYMVFQIFNVGGELSPTTSNPAEFFMSSKTIPFSAFLEPNPREKSKQSAPTSSRKNHCELSDRFICYRQHRDNRRVLRLEPQSGRRDQFANQRWFEHRIPSRVSLCCPGEAPLHGTGGGWLVAVALPSAWYSPVLVFAASPQVGLIGN